MLVNRDLHLFVVLLLIIVAIYLRFNGLTLNSYWNDELATLWLTDPDNSFHFVFYGTLYDHTTPLYQILQWAWFHIFGFTEYAGRSLSALSGVGGVVAIYLLAKELYNRNVAIYALLISTFNYYLIYYSQEARAYSLLFFLAALSTYFLVKVIRKYNRRFLHLYTLCSILLVQTHYYGVLLYFSHICFILTCIFYLKIADKKRIGLLLINIPITLVSLFPAIPYILHDAQKDSFWLSEPEPWFFADYLYDYSGGYIVLALFASLLIYSTWFHIRKTCKYDRFNFYLFLIIITFIYIIPYLRSMVSVPMLHHRYTIAALPVIILLVAHAIELFHSQKTRIFLLAMCLAMSIAGLLVENQYYSRGTKQSFREILTDINTKHEPVPVIACSSGSVNKYLKMLGIGMQTLNFSEFNSLIDNADINRFWLMYHNNSQCNKIRDNREILVKKHRLEQIASYEKKGVQAYLYAKN